MTDLQLLRQELDRLGATGVQRERFESDVPKARSAISKAVQRKAHSPITYALSIFNSDQPESSRILTTNRSALVDCKLCGGDRAVLVRDYDPKLLYDEVYERCPSCNPVAA